MSYSMSALSPLRMLQAAGILAWAMVTWIGWQVAGDRIAPLMLALPSIAFLLGFLYATHDDRASGPRRLDYLALAVEFLAATAILLLMRHDVASVLFIVAVSQLPWFFGMTTSLVVVALFFLGHSLLKMLVWQDTHVLEQTLLYTSFMLFSVFSSHQAMREQKGREETQRLVNELKATQHLLSDTARESERLQIARDLHDTLGHHLTALALQLEIAAHLCEGEARTQVEKSRHLAKLLLADVRATVSDLRDRPPVDLRTALTTLIAGVPRLAITLDFPDEVTVHEPAVADMLLRAAQELITNTLRHAHASRLRLSLSADHGELRLHARDDGRGSATPRFGNGLTGLRERVQALGGSLHMQSTPGSGFEVAVHIPEASA